MSCIKFGDARIQLSEGETVLDALLREKYTIPYSCRAGVCQSCLMRAKTGDVPSEAQKGLKETLRQRGFFLACLCRPKEPLEIEKADNEVNIEGQIIELKRLTATVLQVRIQTAEALPYYAGQFIVLQRADGLSRSYSISNLPDQPFLELHVRRVSDGRMSSWLFDEAQPGLKVIVRGPYGNCFYLPGKAEQPLLLVGTGTGLAPLYGIALDALRQRHVGPIHLYHGASKESHLYLVNELVQLREQHANFFYHPIVLEGPAQNPAVQIGMIDGIVLSAFKNPKGIRSYLCGNPTIVKTLQKKLFLAGQSLQEIFADAFLPSAN